MEDEREYRLGLKQDSVAACRTAENQRKKEDKEIEARGLRGWKEKTGEEGSSSGVFARNSTHGESLGKGNRIPLFTLATFIAMDGDQDLSLPSS